MTMPLPYLPLYVEHLGVHGQAAIERWSGIAYGQVRGPVSVASSPSGRCSRVSVCEAPCRMRIDRLDQQEPFTTADGSTIRELAGVPSGNAVQQSLAEATVPPGGETVEHYHSAAEEIYHFVSGAGRLRLGGEESDVRAGDTVVIAPGARHKLWNRGPDALVLLCCCAPPYSHADTVLCE